MKRPNEEYWRDQRHDALRFSLLDAAGSVIQEVNQWVIKAPLNADSRAPVTIRVELVHEDGCSQLLQATPLNCY